MQTEPRTPVVRCLQTTALLATLSQTVTNLPDEETRATIRSILKTFVTCKPEANEHKI